MAKGKTYAVAKTNTGNTANKQAVAALISPVSEDAKSKGFKVLTSPIVSPSDMPDGTAVQGVLRDIVPSPSKKFKGELLVLDHSSGVSVRFPLSATVKRALGENPRDFIGKELLLEKVRTDKNDRGTINIINVAVRDVE